MRRQALKNLLEWKGSANRKPLILNGARQVGKTWLLREFAKTAYKKEAYIVCRKNDLAKQVFARDFDIGRILRDFPRSYSRKTRNLFTELSVQGLVRHNTKKPSNGWSIQACCTRYRVCPGPLCR